MRVLLTEQMNCMIDAFEHRDVATVDIPGAFLQTRMPEDERDVHVILDGRMAEQKLKNQRVCH